MNYNFYNSNSTIANQGVHQLTMIEKQITHKGMDDIGCTTVHHQLSLIFRTENYGFIGDLNRFDYLNPQLVWIIEGALYIVYMYVTNCIIVWL